MYVCVCVCVCVCLCVWDCMCVGRVIICSSCHYVSSYVCMLEFVYAHPCVCVCEHVCNCVDVWDGTGLNQHPLDDVCDNNLSIHSMKCVRE